MQKCFKHISCLAILCCLLSPSLTVWGQALPALEVADEITRGRLPNGMEYYLVTNTADKGFADFALVRKGEPDMAADRESLRSLPYFGEREPYRFLADNGVGYSEDGFIVHYPEATVFSFNGVPTYDQSAADSTLMMVMCLAATSSSPQAVIVSGDVDASKVKERMGLLSMMVPRLARPFRGGGYIWNPRDSIAFRVGLNQTSDVAVINAIYSSGRLPEEAMNTVQPLVSEAYAYLLGSIAEKRVKRTFREAGVPLAGMRFRYQDSSESPYDERYSFSLATSAEYLDEATRLFASVLSELDRYGAGKDEFEDAKSGLKSIAKRAATGMRLTNSEYVAKCVSSYLYGSNLASETSLGTFIANRKIAADRELELFNGFLGALLDSARNLTLRYDIPDKGLDRHVILGSFNDAWANTAPGTDKYKENFGDTLSLYRPSRKVRLTGETLEPVSGGKMWTFSNGIKVVYKKTGTTGEFRYALMLRGGVSSVPGLHKGEGAFVSDMLGLSDIAGLNGNDFHAMLAANGITMEERASVSDFRIGGIAPKSKFPLLMRSLLSVADRRIPNRAAFEYYKRGEALRIDMESLSPRDVNSLMDSIMRPDYYYTDRKRVDNLYDDLPERAEQYFASLFSKVNDGLLVLIGDLDEEHLKRELCRTVGDFSTQKKYAPRPRISSRFATGSVTYLVESAPGLVGGGERGVNVAISAPVPYNIENYMAFKVAVSSIYKELTAVLADYGAYTVMSDKLEVFPAERMSVFINCRPCRHDGLPDGVEPADPVVLLDAVRKVTADVGRIEISDADLKAYKAALSANYEVRQNDAGAMVDDILARYSEGKDFVAGYSAAINSLSADDVRKILGRLKNGAQVEYVII